MPNIWPQDILDAPVFGSNAKRDPILSAVGKEHYSFSFTHLATSAGGLFKETFQIGNTFNFYLTNVACIRFVDATETSTGSRVGNLTLTDNINNFSPILNLPLLIAGPFLGARRAIWDLPYCFAAGGSFTASVVLPVFSSFSASRQQIIFEGFKDYEI